MKAMLLAAGLGHRMRPLTFRTPKPLLPVLGRPMLRQILERLSRFEVERCVVNLHHLPTLVQQAVDAYTSGPEIRTTTEKEILGTAGGLRHAADLLRGSGPILIHNTDCLSDIDFAALLETHRRSGCRATLVLTEPRPPYAIVETDPAGRVVSIGGRPGVGRSTVGGRWLFTGCHLIDESLLDEIPAGRPSHIVSDVYRGLVASRTLGSYIHRGFWWEFGSPESYLEGSLRLLGLDRECLGAISTVDPLRTLDTSIAAVGDGADLHPSASFEGRVAIGAGARIGAGCRIENTIVMPAAVVGSGSHLRRSIVAGGVAVPPSFEADGRVLAADTEPPGELPAGILRQQGLLVRELHQQGA